MLSVSAGGGRGPDCDEAKAPQQGTRSDHAATSLAKLRARPAGTNFHRVLARPVCGASRGAGATTDPSLLRRDKKACLWAGKILCLILQFAFRFIGKAIKV